MKLLLVSVVAVAAAFATTANGATDSIDGEYAKPFVPCFPTISGLDCSAPPIEEGVAIKARGGDRYYIWVKTRDINGHFCEYTAIANRKDKRLISGSKSYCQVTIVLEHDVATLSSEGEGCRDFCGYRGSLNANSLKRKRTNPTLNSDAPAGRQVAPR
jgi:hypothetical protein